MDDSPRRGTRVAAHDAVPKRNVTAKHTLPGLYHNTGPAFRQATAQLQETLEAEGIPLGLVSGADVHMIPGLAAGLRSGHLLTIADSRYVLIEPPHHVAPPQLEEFFFN